LPQFGKIFIDVTVTVVVKAIAETNFIFCGAIGITGVARRLGIAEEVGKSVTVIVNFVRAARRAEYFGFRLRRWTVQHTDRCRAVLAALTESACPATVSSLYAALAPEGELSFGHITVEPIIDDTIAVVVKAVTELSNRVARCGAALRVSLVHGALIRPATLTLTDSNAAWVTHIEAVVDLAVAVIVKAVARLRRSRIDGRTPVIAISAEFAARYSAHPIAHDIIITVSVRAVGCTNRRRA
jgi:hypothetical protein